jgi:hypothetical protein
MKRQRQAVLQLTRLVDERASEQRKLAHDRVQLRERAATMAIKVCCVLVCDAQ